MQDDAEDAGGRRPEIRAERIRERQSARLDTRMTREMREARQQRRQARMLAEKQAAAPAAPPKAPAAPGPAAAQPAAAAGARPATPQPPSAPAGPPAAPPAARPAGAAAPAAPPAAPPKAPAAPGPASQPAAAGQAAPAAGQPAPVPAAPPAARPAGVAAPAAPPAAPPKAPAPPGPAGQPAAPVPVPARPPAAPAPAGTGAPPPAVQQPPAAPLAKPGAGAPPPAKPGTPSNPWAEAIAAVEVRPVAPPARMRRRHWGLIASFAGVVLLPLLLVAAYMWALAEDQYASSVGFTVRQEETASAGALAGGLAQILGGNGSTSANTRVLYEYIQSQDLVARVQADLDLIGHYSRNWPRDPAYSIWPDATIEELTSFWLRMVRISYDELSGLIEVQVRAHDADFAQAVAERIVAESQEMINQLNAAARRDGLAWAQADLDQAVARLRAAREALTAFRATTQIVDPAADIQGRMGILTSLQQQLAQTLVDYDLLTGAEETDPRRRQMQRRIEVIRDRIAQERQSFAAQDVTISDTDYPTLIARFESLLVDQEVAQATYLAAQAALDGARSRAERQTLYLATYIRPTLAQKSEYPDRPVLTGLAGFFLLMLWSVLALVYYSLRDRG